jgi:hypothetical protein
MFSIYLAVVRCDKIGSAKLQHLMHRRNTSYDWILKSERKGKLLQDSELNHKNVKTVHEVQQFHQTIVARLMMAVWAETCCVEWGKWSERVEFFN